MRNIIRAVFIGLLITLSLSAWCWAQPKVLWEVEVPTEGNYKVFRPRISGDWVMISRIGKYNIPVIAVDMFNIKTGEIFNALDSGNLPWCEFASNQIVYVDPICRTRFIIYNLFTRTQRKINIANGPVSDQVIWANYIVYLGKKSQLFLINTKIGAETMIWSGSGLNVTPCMKNDIVTWRNNTTKRICAYRISTGELLNMSQPGANFAQPRTDGRTIVCGSTSGGVKAYDIATDAWTTISKHGYFCDVDGNIVVYQNGNIVYGYDMVSQTTFQISSTPTVNYAPTIANGHVVWSTQDKVYCAGIAVQ